MWRRLLKFIVPLLLAAALGIGAGGLLGFTEFQCGLWAASLCLLVIWLCSVMGSEAFPVLSWPPVATFVFALFAIGIWLAFFAGTAGAAEANGWQIDGSPRGLPRFLSAIMCALPAIPYGVSAIAGLMLRLGG